MGERPLFFGVTNDDDQSRVLAKPVRVLEKSVYRGPHLYSHIPMIRIQVDLGRLEEWPSDRIDGLADRLLVLLPGLERHGCSYRKRGGFIRRLREGTWFGHIVEHVALELQTLAGDRTTRGKTRSVRGRPAVYNIMFAYRDETVGLAAGRDALELVHSLLPEELRGLEGLERICQADGDYDFAARLDALTGLAARNRFGPTTQSLVDDARRRGIPVMRLDRHSLIQLGHGRNQQRLRASITGRTSHLAIEIAGNKDLAKSLLAESGIPVPKGEVVQTLEEAVRAARRLGYPLVTKPLDGNHGRGVTTDIASETQLDFGFAAAAAHARRVIVEQHFTGRDHRILVVGGEVVAVAERVPACVVGNGRDSLGALIARANEDPRRGEGHERVMTRIRIDTELVNHIEKQGLTVESVPQAGRAVILRPTANLSTGGSAIDRTDHIHPDNIEIARRAASIVGLDVAGIDFIAPDISRSVRETGGGIIEINAAPGFRMHLEPSEGPPRDVARPVLDLLFPDGADGRIPLIAITGTNGKSTVGRMISHILKSTGCTVGLTSTSGVYIGDQLIVAGDATGPKSARMLMRDPNVDVAVLETARGGILREGLAFQDAEIGVVLNVTADHLGLKGIETLEDLASVKSLIVETVRRRGASILNADDPRVAAMARRAGGRLVWFSLEGGEAMPEVVRAHVDEGGMAVVREPGEDGGCLVLHRRGRREMIMRTADIPATLHGAATFNVANALAAIAAAAAHGVPLLAIRSAMATFQSTFEQNPGRLNIHDAHGIRVIVDYAHNAAGLAALGELVDRIRPLYRRTVGMLSIPGDRRDEDIVEMGRLGARHFDKLYFREDPGNRGRPRGAVIDLMRQGALAAGAAEADITLIVNETDAVEAALAASEPGDLLVLTPTLVEQVWRQVVDYRPSGADNADNVVALERRA